MYVYTCAIGDWSMTGHLISKFKYINKCYCINVYGVK